MKPNEPVEGLLMAWIKDGDLDQFGTVCDSTFKDYEDTGFTTGEIADTICKELGYATG